MAGESALYKKFRAEQDAADAAYKSWEKDQWNKNSAEWTKQGYTRTDAPNNVWGSTWSPKQEIEEKEDPTKAWYDHMKTLGYKEEALDDGTKRFTHNNNLYYSNGRAKVDGKMIDYDYKTLAKAETSKLNPKSFDLEAFRKNEGITSSNYINHAGNQYLRYDPDGSGDFYVGTDGSIYQANWFGGGLGNKLDHTTVNRDQRGTYLSNYNNLYNLISNFNVPTNKQGGTMNKVKYFAQGGAPTQEQIDPEMQAKADDLVLKAMQGDTNSQNSVKAIIDAAKKQDAKALQLLPYIQRAMEKAQSQAASAKWGSKLQYIRSLKFAKGGKTCLACMAAGGQTKEKSKTYIAPSDTVHVQGKPKSLVDSQGKKTVKHLPEYTASDYQKDLKDAKKGKKDAANRVEKQDMKTTYGCGGKAGKAKKRYFGGWL